MSDTKATMVAMFLFAVVMGFLFALYLYNGG
jgi:hypothetical protein